MLMCCVCVFSLRQESPDMILRYEPLIYEVVLSQNIFIIYMVPSAALDTHTLSTHTHKVHTTITVQFMMACHHVRSN
jgi:hypothetical protein